MTDDNIIRLQNDAKIPEILARNGTVTLSFGKDGIDTVEVDGSITLSEICFLHKILGKWIDDELEEE